MNFLKSAVRVKLNLTNPYQIKPQYKLFDKPENTVRATLDGKFKINNEYHILRFKFSSKNSEDKCLGIDLGQYVWLNIGGQKRPYVPITPIDEPGAAEFLIKDLRNINRNSFTEKILNLSPNDQIEISGPGTQFTYKGYGKLISGNFSPIRQSFNSSSDVPIEKTYKNIGIITHSSGITTTFSLIESVLMNYDNRTGISLLWLGDKEQDFVFLRQLSAFAEQGKLNLNLMLTSYEQGWVGPYGKLNQRHIEDYMPLARDDTMVIMSAVNKEMLQLIKKMKYPNYIFV